MQNLPGCLMGSCRVPLEHLRLLVPACQPRKGSFYDATGSATPSFTLPQELHKVLCKCRIKLLNSSGTHVAALPFKRSCNATASCWQCSLTVPFPCCLVTEPCEVDLPQRGRWPCAHDASRSSSGCPLLGLHTAPQPSNLQTMDEKQHHIHYSHKERRSDSTPEGLCLGVVYFLGSGNCAADVPTQPTHILQVDVDPVQAQLLQRHIIRGAEASPACLSMRSVQYMDCNANST